MKQKGGYLVISLDFELMWGMFDKVTIEQYGENILGVRHSIPEILALFKENGIHATWATVGMLMHQNKQSLLTTAPRESLQPRYDDMCVSAYTHIATTHIGNNEKNDPYHFAPSLVSEIIATPNQELASHTYSHYYCIDGQNNRPSVYEADLNAQKNIFDTFGIKAKSIIFPRNQTSDTVLTACYEHGFTSYRGTEKHFIYKPRRDDKQSLIIRGLRLLDAYFNISGHNAIALDSVGDTSFHNIPASRFLRPYSKRWRFFESRRMRRIKNSMTHAAKNNEIFHIWFHPHNFGTNRKENMKNLNDLIAHFSLLKDTYGMRSRNMAEISEAVTAVQN
ncbi:polysaccharide deacetylase family protein [Candidatus Pacebacteria bacterium]|nr:polysaccharide deacetylase family protein [Candidatus Paceibacterota bacterium]